MRLTFLPLGQSRSFAEHREFRTGSPWLATLAKVRGLRQGAERAGGCQASEVTGWRPRRIEKGLNPNCAAQHHICCQEVQMSATSAQFTVAAHIMAALGFFRGKEIPSATLAESVNADPTFVRKSLSKLSKAGLIITTRGKNGGSTLTRSPEKITLLDIY